MQVKNVVVINDFNYIQGGASKVAIETARMLKEQGLNVIFFSAVNKVEENIEGIEYISTNQNEALREDNRLKGFINGIYNFKAKKELKKLLKTLDKDNTILHVHGWTKALSSSVFNIAFKMKFKVVLTLHDYFTACPNGGYFNYKENKICKLRPLSWKCIKCNCDSRNYLFKIYRILRQFIQNKIVKLNDKLKYAIGISDLSIEVLKPTLNKNINLKKIYNPIQFNATSEKIDSSGNEYYVFIGRVSKEKGTELFCESITNIGGKGLVIGDGAEKERLKEQYKNIEFVGWKNSAEVSNYLKKARLLIFPSLWYEGAPLTPLEAMQSDIPFIVSNQCSAIEYIPEEIKQYVEFSPNVDELIKKIENTNNNYELIKSKEREAFIKIKKEASNYIINVLDFYKSII